MTNTIVKLILFFSLSILLVGCNVKNDKKNRFDFEGMLEPFLLATKYTKEVSFNKNELDVSTIFIKKTKFEKSEFEKLLFKNDFKKIKPMFDDQDIYCFDEFNQLTITDPKKSFYKNLSGNVMEVDRNNLDKVIILYRYNMYGIDGCN